MQGMRDGQGLPVMAADLSTYMNPGPAGTAFGALTVAEAYRHPFGK